MKPLLIAVMGPTASGKTDLAECLADELDAQLVNADAFQIYRGMDIGTAKPIAKARYRLLDIRDPSEGFGVGEFVPLAHEILLECWNEGRSVVVVGGTGLYIRALFEEYRDMAPAPDSEVRARLNQLDLDVLVQELLVKAPQVAETVDLRNRVRVQRAIERIYAPATSQQWCLPPFTKRKFAILPEASETQSRIERRVQSMVQNGWVPEVRQLMAAGYSVTDPGLRALGYRALLGHLKGEVKLEEAVATTIAETKQYAKRQRTWLRSEPNLVVLDTGHEFEHAARDINEHMV